MQREEESGFGWLAVGGGLLVVAAGVLVVVAAVLGVAAYVVFVDGGDEGAVSVSTVPATSSVPASTTTTSSSSTSTLAVSTTLAATTSVEQSFTSSTTLGEIACHSTDDCPEGGVSYDCVDGNVERTSRIFYCTEPGTPESECKSRQYVGLEDYCQDYEVCIPGRSTCRPESEAS